MPPPEVVTNALKHLLGEVPSLKAELFEPAYPSVKQELKYGGSGRSILLLMLGMSYSKPHMMGYQIDLSGVEGVQPDYDAFDTYHVWLTDVSSDLERNRQAFTLALRSLIEQEGTTILMRTWNVPTMLPA
ncbi:hypothetical protein C8Q77DRAFT_1159107 [Trametes polyzona]|nr:hypothetical protein C8Q77DRAFT_1159107 [Trametes polyzona]